MLASCSDIHKCSVLDVPYLAESDSMMRVELSVDVESSRVSDFIKSAGKLATIISSSARLSPETVDAALESVSPSILIEIKKTHHEGRRNVLQLIVTKDAISEFLLNDDLNFTLGGASSVASAILNHAGDQHEAPGNVERHGICDCPIKPIHVDNGYDWGKPSKYGISTYRDGVEPLSVIALSELDATSLRNLRKIGPKTALAIKAIGARLAKDLGVEADKISS